MFDFLRHLKVFTRTIKAPVLMDAYANDAERNAALALVAAFRLKARASQASYEKINNDDVFELRWSRQSYFDGFLKIVDSVVALNTSHIVPLITPFCGYLLAVEKTKYDVHQKYTQILEELSHIDGPGLARVLGHPTVNPAVKEATADFYYAVAAMTLATLAASFYRSQNAVLAAKASKQASIAKKTLLESPAIQGGITLLSEKTWGTANAEVKKRLSGDASLMEAIAGWMFGDNWLALYGPDLHHPELLLDAIWLERPPFVNPVFARICSATCPAAAADANLPGSCL